MRTPAIGMDIGDLRLPPKQALHEAAALSFRVLELPTIEGDFSAESLSSSGRRHLMRYVSGLGLDLAALRADLPGLTLTDPQTVEERIDRTEKILRLAGDLHVPIVTAWAGALTHPESGEPSPTAVAALERLGDFADRYGVSYALRPSRDGAERIAALLKRINCPALSICLDPAAMVMSGVNPMALIERLPGRIKLLHARDGTAGRSDRAGCETALGEGEVDLVGLCRSLTDAEYPGPYILRRADSQRPAAELAAGRDTMLKLLG